MFLSHCGYRTYYTQQLTLFSFPFNPKSRKKQKMKLIAVNL